MSTLRNRLRSDGFADLGQIDPAAHLAEAACELSNSVRAADLSGPERLQISVPDGKRLNTYGGNYGLSTLPLHTDLAHWHRPPRYVVLRCLEGSTHVSTNVLHRRDLENTVPQSLMRRAMFSPRRRLDDKMYLLRMLTDELFRWDELFLAPKNGAAVEALQRMREVSDSVNVNKIILSRPGHTLMIDNWQALHGRSSVPASEIGRRLERTYLEEITDGHEDPT
jgi:L-asparagine oxygenase